MNILFFGDLNSYGRSFHRKNTLSELGHNVSAVSYVEIKKNKQIASYGLINKIFWRLKIPFADNNSNRECIKLIYSDFYEILWIDNGLIFFPWTLNKIKRISPNTKIVLFSEDNLCVLHGMTLWLRLNFKNFSAIFTTKSHNIEKLLSYGQENVFKVFDSFIPALHKPMQLDNKLIKRDYISDVSVIGAFEIERANTLEYLASKDIEISVWGIGWSKFKTKYPSKLKIRNKFLFSEEYAYVINNSKININFLRKINMDSITSRSIEIPACHGFMLSERTSEQKNILEEGVDADYFSTNEELLKKIYFYLHNEPIRKKIAFSGYKKVYSLELDIQSILNHVVKITISLNNICK
jgi:hypothetical protein